MCKKSQDFENSPVFAIHLPRIRGFCRLCGGAIRTNESGLRYHETILCSDCISDVSVGEIMRICEFSSREEILEALGFSPIQS